MYFVILATDRPGAAPIRADARPAHLEYLKGFGDRIVAGGATLSDDGEGVTNTMEGYWAQLKRGIQGCHIHVSRKHL